VSGGTDRRVERPIVFLVDDDLSVLKSLPRALEQYDLEVRAFSNASEFLQSYGNEHGCLVLDLSLPEMNGLELQTELKRLEISIPVIFITGHGGITESVRALRAGAIDFIEKPFKTDVLLERIDEALKKDKKNRLLASERNEVLQRFSKLTHREKVVFKLLLESEEVPSSKGMARTLGISHRTVEHHRSRILEKMNVSSVLELRLVYRQLDEAW